MLGSLQTCSGNLLLACAKSLQVGLTFIYNAAFRPVLSGGF
jgi:hypothetical protein